MANYLVTGGSGFIGGHLVELLKEEGHRVTIYDVKPPAWFEHEIIVTGDILDRDNLLSAAKGSDGIFDCSGILGSAETFGFIEKTLRVNFLGTMTVLDVAKELDIPVVYLSLKNEWKNPYMISKRAGTELCEMYYKYHGVKTIAIRGLNAYGPRQHWYPIKKMFPRFVTRLLTGKPIKIYGDGRQVVDMIYVRDMAKIMSLAMESGNWGDVFDAGSGRPRLVKDIAEDLLNLFGGEIKYVKMRLGEPERAIALADPSYVLQKLDYYPETTWTEGVNETITWYSQILKGGDKYVGKKSKPRMASSGES